LSRAKRTVSVAIGSLVAALALVAAGCGGGDDGETLKIVSDLPLQGSNLVQTEQMVQAIEYVLEQADFTAGDYEIEYESFDDAIASTGNWDEAKCAENGRTYADDEEIVAVIGTYNSGCAGIIIPIVNEAGLAMISPANTAVGLTHEGPGASPGEPEKFYPTGERNYVRVVASDDFQGGVGAQYMMNELGVTSVFILDDKEQYGKGVADAFEIEAREIGLEVAGHVGWDRDAPNYTALMTQIRSTGADGIYIGGVEPNNGGQLMRDKVAVLGDNEQVKVIATDGFVTTSWFDTAGAETVEGAYGTAPTRPADQLTAGGQEFLEGFNEVIGDAPLQVYTLYAAAATQAILDAIARSDGSRADVIAKMFETDVETVVGPMSFNADGDPAGGTQHLFRAEDGAWVWQQELTLQ